MIDSIKINYKDGSNNVIKLPEKNNYCHADSCTCPDCFKKRILFKYYSLKNSKSNPLIIYLELALFLKELMGVV